MGLEVKEADVDVVEKLPPLAPRFDNVFATVVRLGRLWRTRLDERLAPLGLTHSRWVTLIVLSAANEGLLQRELASYVGVEGPTLCRVLDGLQRIGLIERREAAHDRRGKTIRLTPLAEPLINQIAAIASDLRAEAIAGLAPEDVDQADRVLKTLMGNLESIPALRW